MSLLLPSPLGARGPRRSARLVLSLVGAALAACAGSPASPAVALPADGAAAAAPSAPNWKERIEQPYVFVEHVGDYRRVGDAMRALLLETQRAGLAPAGPAFALYYDDPATVPATALRARACLPVDPGAWSPPAGSRLGYEVLPRAMVAYATTTGSFPSTAPAYAALFEYVRSHGWSATAPIREVYRPVESGGVPAVATEVQMPWTNVPAVAQTAALELPPRCR